MPGDENGGFTFVSNLYLDVKRNQTVNSFSTIGHFIDLRAIRLGSVVELALTQVYLRLHRFSLDSYHSPSSSYP
jgi:hypothetical protein